jgi:hypothetical protein
MRVAETCLWIAHQAPSRGAADDTHRIGLGLGSRAARTWIEARDHPWRSSAGLSARVRLLEVAVAVETHPLLGETLRLGCTIGKRGAR